jgi:hypothetical protein
MEEWLGTEASPFRAAEKGPSTVRAAIFAFVLFVLMAAHEDCMLHQSWKESDS